MKQIIILLFCPMFTLAQKSASRFENDTLYTSCGFKIYAGQTLNFAKGTAKNGYFRFVRVISSNNEREQLTDNSVVVKSMSKYSVSGLGNGYIKIKGFITFKDHSKGEIEFNMAFDKAIEGFPGLSSEMIVPDEFKNKEKSSVSGEISKLYKLYQDSIITKEEFELQKKKLLNP